MSVGAIDCDHIDFGLGQFLSALEKISGGANCPGYAKPAMRIFGSIRVFQFFLDVFDCDQTFQVVLVVHNQQFFNAMFVKNFFGLFKRGSHGDGDEIFLRHYLVYWNVEARLEAQVAIGQNANQLAALLSDGHTGDFVLSHDLQGVRDLGIGLHGDGVHDHAAFGPFYFVDFVRLLFDG